MPLAASPGGRCLEQGRLSQSCPMAPAEPRICWGFHNSAERAPTQASPSPSAKEIALFFGSKWNEGKTVSPAPLQQEAGIAGDVSPEQDRASSSRKSPAWKGR